MFGQFMTFPNVPDSLHILPNRISQCSPHDHWYHGHLKGAIPAIPISPCAPGQRWGTFVGHRRRLPGCLRGLPFKIPMKDGRIPFNPRPIHGGVECQYLLYLLYIFYIFKWHVWQDGPMASRGTSWSPNMSDMSGCGVLARWNDSGNGRGPMDRLSHRWQGISLLWLDMSSILKASSAVNQFNPTKSNLPMIKPEYDHPLEIHCWVNPDVIILGCFTEVKNNITPVISGFCLPWLIFLCRGIPFKTSPFITIITKMWGPPVMLAGL